LTASASTARDEPGHPKGEQQQGERRYTKARPSGIRDKHEDGKAASGKYGTDEDQYEEWLPR
jgi:hypothetical protein